MDRRTKKRAIPTRKVAIDDRWRGIAGKNLAQTHQDGVEGLVVTFRGHGAHLDLIRALRFRGPFPGGNPGNQLPSDLIAFDGKRVIGVVGVDFRHPAEVGVRLGGT